MTALVQERFIVVTQPSGVVIAAVPPPSQVVFGVGGGSGSSTPTPPITGFALEATQQDLLTRLAEVLAQLQGTLAVDTGLTLPPDPARDTTLMAILSALGAPVLPAGSATEAKQLPNNHQVSVSNLPQVQAITGGVTTDDSSEREYAPGLVSDVATQAGDKTIYIPTPGKAWRLRWAYAVPVLRGSEEPPVITIKTVNASGELIKTLYSVAAVSKRKVITMPAGARLVVNLDVPVRVPVTFDIEELP